ncbi:DUF452 family protein [Caviibacterium pharyngocola]|uniref:DUF452 domain-containing protein n=1 Tax=Caviibacterium pharyngocola TaxID=28159 RepID=A0A2M8RXR2_9PAST|nr:pimeloyl-ACP methyl esterase BioG family protein [Caviibacterium pharyngocola]PJG83666.1 DUF452 domain-containing protein [Caviibacterium pharyngocola]
MQTKAIYHNGTQLIVYFAGWGTPPSTVEHLCLPPDTDLLICYNYQDLSLNVDFSAYQGIKLVAWSMGVWAADQVMAGVPLLSATAINGTGAPCHDQFGIPTAIFQGTLEGLNESNLVKFQRRMCGDKTVFQQYQQLEGLQSAVENQQELTALYQGIQQPSAQAVRWTKAVIGQQDRIFPPENQQRYWQSYFGQHSDHIVESALPHYPFAAFSHWAELC